MKVQICEWTNSIFHSHPVTAACLILFKNPFFVYFLLWQSGPATQSWYRVGFFLLHWYPPKKLKYSSVSLVTPVSIRCVTHRGPGIPLSDKNWTYWWRFPWKSIVVIVQDRGYEGKAWRDLAAYISSLTHFSQRKQAQIYTSRSKKSPHQYFLPQNPFHIQLHNHQYFVILHKYQRLEV